MNDMSDAHGHAHEWVETPLPQRADWFFIVPVVTTLAYRVARTVTLALDTVDDIARSHAYWRLDRNDFLNDVREDFERIWESQPET